MNRSRRSRFANSAPEVEAPTSDERVTPDERLNRQLADIEIRRGVGRGKADLADRIGGVPPDADVATGAVAAVEQGSHDWRARWVLVDQDGQLVVRSIHLEPDGQTTPPGGVTTNLLRELSPSAAIAAGAARLAGELDRTSWEDLRLIWVAHDVHEHAPMQAGHISGRPRLSDEHLAAVAVAYIEELGHGRGVLRRLGKRFDREPETMRDHVRIARERGFLTPALGAGRKGAAPGHRLIELMSGTDQRGEEQ